MPDLIDFSAQIVHVDTSAWTHSLPGTFGAAAIFFVMGWIITRSVAASVLVGIIAASHVLADLLPVGSNCGLADRLPDSIGIAVRCSISG